MEALEWGKATGMVLVKELGDAEVASPGETGGIGVDGTDISSMDCSAMGGCEPDVATPRPLTKPAAPTPGVDAMSRDWLPLCWLTLPLKRAFVSARLEAVSRRGREVECFRNHSPLPPRGRGMDSRGVPRPFTRATGGPPGSDIWTGTLDGLMQPLPSWPWSLQPNA